MSIELLLVEGVSDVQFISYYLQNVYEWKHEKTNVLKMEPMDSHEHIENLCKGDNHLILCGVGGNGRFKHFVDNHRINEIIIENDIQSVMVATDRDEDSNNKILRSINSCFKSIKFNCGKWTNNSVNDSFGQNKNIDTYLLIVPESDKGALEKVLIDALKDMSDQVELMQEVVNFIDTLKAELVPDLTNANKANKAAIGTFFSIRYPQNPPRLFTVFVSKIDWSKSEKLTRLFYSFEFLGCNKTDGNKL